MHDRKTDREDVGQIYRKNNQERLSIRRKIRKRILLNKKTKISNYSRVNSAWHYIIHSDRNHIFKEIIFHSLLYNGASRHMNQKVDEYLQKQNK